MKSREVSLNQAIYDDHEDDSMANIRSVEVIGPKCSSSSLAQVSPNKDGDEENISDHMNNYGPRQIVGEISDKFTSGIQHGNNRDMPGEAQVADVKKIIVANKEEVKILSSILSNQEEGERKLRFRRAFEQIQKYIISESSFNSTIHVKVTQIEERLKLLDNTNEGDQLLILSIQLRNF